MSVEFKNFANLLHEHFVSIDTIQSVPQLNLQLETNFEKLGRLCLQVKGLQSAPTDKKLPSKKMKFRTAREQRQVIAENT